MIQMEEQVSISSETATESTESYGKCNTENTAHVFYSQ